MLRITDCSHCPLPANGVPCCAVVSGSYVKEYLGVSVSPASVSLQSVVDAQQKLLSEKEAEIAALKRRVEALERDAAGGSGGGADSSSRQTTADSSAGPAAVTSQ